MNRLGIIDWGIGGVSVFRLIREQIGDVPVTYLSDTGVTPYGRMSRPELVARLNTVIGFLKSRGVTHILIGCNAASTAIPFLADHGIPVKGVIEPAVELVTRLQPRDLGLIGGRRTVVSGVYRNGFAERGIAVKQRIAQPLSALIESGDISSPQLRTAAAQILAPLRSCSHILLACTHYPAIASILAEYVSNDTVLVDPAAELLDTVCEWQLGTGGRTGFLTTGDATAMAIAAKNAFGVTIEHALVVKV